MKICEDCKQEIEKCTCKPADKASDKLFEGEDFYIENGFTVFTKKFLLKRGYCCSSGCRHCPY